MQQQLKRQKVAQGKTPSSVVGKTLNKWLTKDALYRGAANYLQPVEHFNMFFLTHYRNLTAPMDHQSKLVQAR